MLPLIDGAGLFARCGGPLERDLPRRPIREGGAAKADRPRSAFGRWYQSTATPAVRACSTSQARAACMSSSVPKALV